MGAGVEIEPLATVERASPGSLVPKTAEIMEATNMLGATRSLAPSRSRSLSVRSIGL